MHKNVPPRHIYLFLHLAGSVWTSIQKYNNKKFAPSSLWWTTAQKKKMRNIARQKYSFHFNGRITPTEWQMSTMTYFRRLENGILSPHWTVWPIVANQMLFTKNKNKTWYRKKRTHLSALFPSISSEKANNIWLTHCSYKLKKTEALKKKHFIHLHILKKKIETLKRFDYIKF